MRTIKKNLFNRLVLQAEEAEIQGLTKVAESLTTQITKNADNLRDDSVLYRYSAAQFGQDIHEKLWDFVIRTADFYNVSLEAQEMQKIIERYAADMIHEISNKLGINHSIGAYEEPLPGEQVEIIISDKD